MAQTITVRLDLDASDLVAEVASSNRALDRLTDTLKKQQREMRNSQRHTENFSTTLRHAVITFGLIRQAAENFSLILFGPLNTIIRMNSEIERLEYLMRGLSQETNLSKGFAGINEEAAAEMEYMINLARTAPFELNIMTEAFAKLKTVGLDNTRDSFQSLIDAAAKFGRTSGELGRAAVAIQQMSGKGVISMEELRQQLGEAVPNAIQVMSRALNISMGELIQVVSTGTLKSEEALKGFFEQLELETKGSALYMAETFEGTLQRMHTNIKLLAKSLGDGGFFEVVKVEFRNFVDGFLVSEQVTEQARLLGRHLGIVAYHAAELVKQFAAWIAENKELIATVIKLGVEVAKAIVTLKLMSVAYGLLRAAAIGAMTAVKASALTFAGIAAKYTAAQAAVSAFAIRIGMATAGLGIFKGVLAGTIIVLKGMVGVIWGLLGPIGLAVAAIAALYLGFKKLREGGAKATEAIVEHVRIAIAQQRRLTEQELQELSDLILEKEKQIAQQTATLNASKGRGGGGAALAQQAALEESIRRTKVALNELIDLKAKAGKVIASMFDAKVIQNFEREVYKETLALRNANAKAINDAIKKVANSEKTSLEKRNEVQKVKAASTRKVLDAEILLWETYRDKQLKIFNDLKIAGQKSGDAQYDAQLEQVTIIRERLRSLQEQRLAVDDEVDALALTTGVGSTQGKKDKTLAFYQQLSVRLAGVKEKLAAMNIEFAKTQTRFDKGLIDPKHKLAPEINQMSIEFDEATKRVKVLTKALSIQEKAQRRIVDVTAFMQAQDEKNKNKNPFLKAGQQASFFRIQIEKLRSDMEQVQKDLGPDSRLDTSLIENLENMLPEVDLSAASAGITQMELAMESWYDSLGTADEQAHNSFARQRMYLEEFSEKYKDVLTVEMRETIAQYGTVLAEQERIQTDAIAKMLKEWEEMSYELDDIFADLFDGMSDALTDFIVDGKADFAGFLEDIYRQILNTQIKKAFASLFEGFAIGGAGGGFFGAFGGGGGGGGTWNWAAAGMANGGIVDQYGVVPLKQYAQGGIARSPQLSLFGEGSRPEAYVPLPDGRSIPVAMEGGAGAGNVTVNVINESGQAVEAEQQGEPRFDAGEYIVDVVMKKIASPGPMRNAIKGVR